MSSAMLVEACHQLIAMRQERAAFALRDGVGCGQLDAERVHMSAIDLELVMQMRTCRQPGHANITDYLTLGYIAASPHAGGVAAHMGVQGLIVLAVLDDNGVAIAALAAYVHHAPITGRLDGCSGRSCVIHPLVSADLVQYRVPTVGVEA